MHAGPAVAAVLLQPVGSRCITLNSHCVLNQSSIATFIADGVFFRGLFAERGVQGLRTGLIVAACPAVGVGEAAGVAGEAEEAQACTQWRATMKAK